MPPRRRPQFTQETVEQQLQQIHLLDPSSSSENLEQLGPIIKQIHQTRQQDAYLRTLQSVIDAKDAEIEAICGDNYQDFISSVSTLFTVKSYTNNLRDKINTLDSSVSQVGRGLVEKKRALLQAKKTAANLDEAIDNMQAGLRVLDVVDRVGEMVKEGKYWSALRVCVPCVIMISSLSLRSRSTRFNLCLQAPWPRRLSTSIFLLHSRPYEDRSRMLLQLRINNGYLKFATLLAELAAWRWMLWTFEARNGDRVANATHCSDLRELVARSRL